MKSPKAVVIVTEGVGAGMLGPYGSATATTPAINRLAAGSLVLDQCLVDSFQLPEQLRSLWTASHARQVTAPTWNLWQYLATLGLNAQLLTDSPEVAELAEQAGCARVLLVDVSERSQPAELPEECSLVQVFAAAIEMLSASEAPDVLWIHARALRWPWDAPLELRAAMIDPEDPPPPSEVGVPQMALEDDSDPDLVVGWGQVAAAQLAVLDEALDGLEQAIQARSDAGQWSWMFCSLGGISLGEHQQLGSGWQAGYSEEIAVAALVRAAGSIPIGVRRSELCQLPDLPITLLAAMGILPESAQVWGRNLWSASPPSVTTKWPTELGWAWGGADDKLWLRTAAWSYIQRSTESVDLGESVELYVKPDDRWEVNDVADRSSEVVEELTRLLPQVQAATQAGTREQLPPVPEALASLFR